MNCEVVQERLSAYLDCELLPTEKEEVEEHLTDCSLCLRECQHLLEVRKKLRSLPACDLPPEFITNLGKRLVPQSRKAIHQEILRTHSQTLLRPVLTLTTLILLIVLAVVILKTLPSHTPETTTIVEGQEKGTNYLSPAYSPMLAEYYNCSGHLPFTDEVTFTLMSTEHVAHLSQTAETGNIYEANYEISP